MPGAGTCQGSQGGDVGAAGCEYAGRSRPVSMTLHCLLVRTHVGPDSMLSPVGTLPPGLQWLPGKGLEALRFFPYEEGKCKVRIVRDRGGQGRLS